MSVEPIRPSASGLDAGKESRAAQGLPIVPALDGFRALAIFAIVFLHLISVFLNPTSSTGEILTYGPLPNAVDVLFIISGFVVFLPTVARGGDFGPVIPYAIRRAARLIPAYWVAIALVLLLIAIWPTSPGPVMPGATDIGVHVLGLQVPVHFFDTDSNLGLSIDGPLWTLSLEVTFYVLLPLIATWYFRHPFVGLGAAVLVTVGWKLGAENMRTISDALGFAPSPERLAGMQRSAYSQFPAFAVQFALGMTAAWLLVNLPRRFDRDLLARRAVWVQAVSLIAFLALSYPFGRYALDAQVLAPTIARGEILLTLAIPLSLTAFMLATAFAPRRLQMPFALPAMRSLGDISYGAYLMHFPLIILWGAVVSRFFGGADSILVDFWVASPIVLVLAIGYGYLSGRFLETPIRRWAHRYGRRGASRAPRAETQPVGQS